MEDRISPIVEEFTFRSLEGDTLDLDASCARFPLEIRAELRSRSRATWNIQRSLRAVPKRVPMPTSHIGEFEIRRDSGGVGTPPRVPTLARG
ncbi:MAG: hypothetical protein E2O39_17555 [Planctomycetota bacterium]|nr:MAG: hypothetical protein E2O39_17555 [Planctomycetota bacterium]